MRTEDRLRELLGELAESTPIRPDLAAARARATDIDPPADYPALVDVQSERTRHASRSGRRRWMVAAVTVVVLGIVGLTISVWSGREGAMVKVADSDLPIDTAALGGGRLAFVAENNLHVADGATGVVKKLTDVGKGNEVSHVSLSADGQWVAFSIHDVAGWWIASVDGSTVTHLSDSNDPASAAWSPTTNELAFVVRNEVRIAGVDGKVRTLEGPVPKSPTNVVWAPDGTALAYATAEDELAVIGLDGVVRVESNPAIPLLVVVGWGAGGPIGLEGLGSPTERFVAWSVDNWIRDAVIEGPIEWHNPASYLDVSEDGERLVAAASSTPSSGTEATLHELGTGSFQMLPGGPWREPVLSPGASRVAAFGPGGLFLILPGGDPLLLAESPESRGTIFREDGGYGVTAEPPVWIDDSALIARIDEQRLVRIDVDSGAQTVIVEVDRFLEPTDSYPGGVGFTYWHP